MKINKYGFTLVELIVVITILAILGTIAFINLQGYSAGARDSKRVSDINNIIKKVSIEQVKGVGGNELIENQESKSVVINGIPTNAIQGSPKFSQLKEEGNNFKDPVTKKNYLMSYTQGGTGTGAYKFIQIATVNEEKNEAVVKGNYYMYNSGTDSPSIIKNTSDLFVVDGGSQLPYELIAGSGDNSTLFEKLIVYLQDSQLGIDPDLFIKKLIEYNGKIYFTDSNNAFYSMDSNSNVVQINDYTFSKPIIFNNKLFYGWTDVNNGYTNYLSYIDGTTTTNIQMEVTMNAGVIQYYMYNTIYNNKLYFWGNDTNTSYGTELYSIDTSNNLSVIDINPSGDGLAWNGSSFGVYNNKLYFWANDGGALGDELYSLDSSNNLVHIPIQTGGTSKPNSTDSFAEFNGKLYFNAIGDGTGEELFFIDNLDNLSYIDINSGSNNSNPHFFNIYNNRLYFIGYNISICWELYYIDTSNNSGFYDIDAGSNCGNPRNLFVQDTHLYFSGVQAWTNHSYAMDLSNLYTELPSGYYIWNSSAKFENKLFYINIPDNTLDYIDGSGNRNSISNLNLIIPM